MRLEVCLVHARAVSLFTLLVALLSSVPAVVTPAMAQTTTGTITGVVCDTSGGVFRASP